MTLQQDLPEHVSYARVVTPGTTYHAYTLQHIDRNVLLHVSGDTIVLSDVTVTETVQGWRCAGTNMAGEPEVWTVRKLSCGCNRSITSTRSEDVPT